MLTEIKNQNMILTISLIICCTLLISLVLMQNSDGGIRSQTVKSIVGVKKASMFIEKATFTLAILVMLFAMFN